MTPNQFKKAKVKLGWKTQEDAAKVLGVTRPAISMWETGRRPIPKYVEKFLEILLELFQYEQYAAAANAEREDAP